MTWRIPVRYRRSARIPKRKYVNLAITIFDLLDGTYGAVLDPRYKQFGIQAEIVKAGVDGCKFARVRYALKTDQAPDTVWHYAPIFDPVWHNSVRAQNRAPLLTQKEIADMLKRPILISVPNQIVRHKGRRKPAQ